MGKNQSTSPCSCTRVPFIPMLEEFAVEQHSAAQFDSTFPKVYTPRF